jgi:hypothetical protein
MNRYLKASFRVKEKIQYHHYWYIHCTRAEQHTGQEQSLRGMGMVMHNCNLGYLGGRNGRIAVQD